MVGDPNTNPARTNADPGYFAILDRYGRPFLYYPGLGKPNITIKDGFIRSYDPASTVAEALKVATRSKTPAWQT